MNFVKYKRPSAPFFMLFEMKKRVAPFMKQMAGSFMINGPKDKDIYHK